MSADLAPPAHLVIGDSLTARGEAALRGRVADLDVDAVRGSNVLTLHDRIRAWRDRHGQPTSLTVALGTNSHASVDKHFYVSALWLVWRRVPVVLVTPFVVPDLVEPQIAARVASYAGWLREIGAERPRTYVADWAEVAQRRPDLLQDWAHQTSPEGEEVWARVVEGALRHAMAELV